MKSVSDIAQAAAGLFDRGFPARSGRGGAGAIALGAVDAGAWRDLARHAAEPNGYFHPGWLCALNASAPGRMGAKALVAWDGRRLAALLPVTSAWQAVGIPLPILVSADPYGTLGTPLLDAEDADRAASGLLTAARSTGARAILLRDLSLDGPAAAALGRAAAALGVTPLILRSHHRAALDATQDADDLLREALGPKKLKELRRQRNRLAETGEVRLSVATTPDDAARALDVFLALEASGWKAQRGTALAQRPGDEAFIRGAVADLAMHGGCEIAVLSAGDTPVAAGIVLRQGDRAFYFKLGVDERFARLSPGVQLTVELTRRYCADPVIALVDSTAAPGHPMIEPIWRGRLGIGDMLLPLAPRDPAIAPVAAALRLRTDARETARRLVRKLRALGARTARPPKETSS